MNVPPKVTRHHPGEDPQVGSILVAHTRPAPCLLSSQVHGCLSLGR